MGAEMMFRKTSPTDSQMPENCPDNAPTQTGRPAGEARDRQHSFISKDAKLKADLMSSGDVTFEGYLDGTIRCRVLTLSGQPCVSGSIEAETVHVCGAFDGDLCARKVVLTKTAKMTGNIFQESLEIHQGASFEGRVSRLDDASLIKATTNSTKSAECSAPIGDPSKSPPIAN